MRKILLLLGLMSIGMMVATSANIKGETAHPVRHYKSTYE